ncbi:hypothetical protein GALL_442570 [mine drainage metagenome]|uniref:Uncharacterized protein n=1 Tax=mine drainage metagenome TaxID=410659 RepID=A0A1J5Q9D7_9ZZZZ
MGDPVDFNYFNNWIFAFSTLNQTSCYQCLDTLLWQVCCKPFHISGGTADVKSGDHLEDPHQKSPSTDFIYLPTEF